MIYSMTGFARAEQQGDYGTLTCEMRSINHRYLELSVHLPESLRTLEMPLRENIRQLIKRGKVECHVRYQGNVNTKSTVVINLALVQALCEATQKVAAFLPQAAPVNPADILNFSGVLTTSDTNLGFFEEEVMQVVRATSEGLVSARLREGEDLKLLFLQRLDAITEALKIVHARIPIIKADQTFRLHKRFTEANLVLEAGRLEQEIVLFAQKMDVTEEIDRLEAHANEMRRILLQGGTVGRRLDFLLQELNREANTLGSKSVDTPMSHAAIEIKVLIEQMREQVQNLE